MQIVGKRLWLTWASGLAFAAGLILVLTQIAHAAPGDQLPAAKQTRAGLYLEAREVPAFIAQQDDGYTRVCSVIDRLEDDLSPEGHRYVNGWKNAGLPWSYRLDKAKMYFPR